MSKVNKWYVMAAVIMGTFLATIDGSIVNVSLPVMVTELHSNFVTMQWVILAYLVTVTTLMLSIGRLADMIGKKPLYTAGMVVFTIGSMLCGLSPTVTLLIAARVLQAIGAAMIMAIGTAIVTEAFPPEERGRALGINGLMVSLGIIAGPTVGGIIVQSLSWHWIFFVNLPVGIIGIFLVLRFVPNLRPKGGQRFDFFGAVTLFACLMSFLVALSIGQTMGFTAWPVLLLFALFVALLYVFIRVEMASPQPMMDLTLFRSILFSINLITGFLTFVASSGILLLMPFYLENVLRLDPMSTGLLMAVSPLVVGFIAPFSGSLSDRFGTRSMTAIGLGFIVISYITISTLTVVTTPLGYALRYAVMGIGVGMFQSPNNSAVMGAVPRDRLGVASGLLSITRTAGQVVGISVLGAMWSGFVAAQGASADTIGGVTSATPAVQTLALRQVLVYVVVMMTLAMLLSIWALWKERSTLSTKLQQSPAGQGDLSQVVGDHHQQASVAYGPDKPVKP